MIAGTNAEVKGALRNAKEELADAEGNLTLQVMRPDGHEYTREGEQITHDGTGLYHADVATPSGAESIGVWHYRWLDEGQVADEGIFVVESEWVQGTSPDLSDLKVLVPRARRRLEGPWGNANGRPPLTETQVYEMVADAVGNVVMLGGGTFTHSLIVKARDPLVGFPIAWKTDSPLNEYEGAIICAQAALEYYTHIFATMKVSETIRNEGTEWTYQLSANLLRNYLEGLKDERDKAIEGLRINKPVLDRFASNIRVRDQATVAVLEWWDINSPGLSGGGLPGGQEATSIPWFPQTYI